MGAVVSWWSIQARGGGLQGSLDLFPYDLAEFVSPWQCFGGGDKFSKRKCDVADRKVTDRWH
jgi:hypothetical protein